MKIIRLAVQPMTAESFARYGVVIDQRGSVSIDIGGGVPSMTGATAERRPFSFEFMARHTRTMQVFSPMIGSQSIIAVAPPGERAPHIEEVVAFHVDGRHPYAFHRGTWHTPPFPLYDWASYLVIDRDGTLEDDYELFNFRATHGIAFELEF